MTTLRDRGDRYNKTRHPGRTGWEKGGPITKRKRVRSWPTKGSYPHPAGGYIHHFPAKLGQRIRVTAHLKAEPDTKKLAMAVVELAKRLEREQRRTGAERAFGMM